MIRSEYVHDQYDFLKRGPSTIVWLKVTEYSATLCIVLFVYFSILRNITINNYMDGRITDCTVALRDDSVVSVASNHFEDYHRWDHYYDIVLKIIQGDKKAHIKWSNDDDAVSIEKVELL